ncbi:HipA domain protein [Denitrovibrio acetiphilus DSM 12809]|jgi:serine/threonine-protein kinase HipA|uniref:HipA domain protein n=1 Tax=Denitrovibrio acetiphilus (strain DSM 12809 / NBRC 114555 / N2460) TaxID=522772 RepID=D4H556_DENA2|nr:type II toxin-antitoxin system HipA family toxin [Denitrovibrio acetiphilus]ADD69412.1 HipA domain protein [Denitrovibrio acetiphilus DSM 12809]
MVEVATVHLWNMKAGAVSWDDERNVASFQYYPEFIRHELDISPIHMPVYGSENNIYEFPSLPMDTYYGLPGLLADSLPDKFGNTILNAWLAQQSRTPADMLPVERLCYLGNRGMGALEYTPAIYKKTKAEKIDIEEMTGVVADILAMRQALNTNTGSKGVVQDIVSVGTSAGGARAKAVVAYNQQTGDLYSGQLKAPRGAEHWLLKFDGVNPEGDPEGFGRVEFAYYQMAIACGIEMTKCHLLEIGKHAHFMTKRFDRIGNEKLHLQSLCGIAHFDFNNSSAYAYEDAFQIMRNLRLTYSDAEQLYRRMIFNVLTYNRDDHTKNISFLMDKKGKWSLSPAYDMTFSYRPDSPWVSRHQMSVNGKRERITTDDFLAVANGMNIKKPKEIIEQISGTVHQWKTYAKEAGVEPSICEQIEKLINGDR